MNEKDKEIIIDRYNLRVKVWRKYCWPRIWNRGEGEARFNISNSIGNLKNKSF